MRALASVTGYGVTTSVGGNTAQSCAALRAGIARFELTDLHLCMPFDEFADDLDTPPASLVPGIPFNASGVDRLLPMIFPALSEAIVGSGLPRTEFASWSLHLALPDAARPDMPGLDTLAKAVVRRAALPAPMQVTVARAGHSGFADAVIAAGNAFRTGSRTAVVISADTLLHRPTLQWLDAADRLKCPRVADGVIPGEAAAVLVLRPGAGSADHPTIAAVAATEDPAPVLGDAPGVGVGLCEAVRAASAQCGQTAIEWALLDQNGERYRAQEWGYTLTRLHTHLGSLKADWVHADCIGDVGAASGGLAAARAVAAWGRGHAPSNTAWILLSADSGGRGAVVLSAPGGAS